MSNETDICFFAFTYFFSSNFDRSLILVIFSICTCFVFLLNIERSLFFTCMFNFRQYFASLSFFSSIFNRSLIAFLIILFLIVINSIRPDIPVKNVISRLERFGTRLCCVNLVDSHYCSDGAKFVSVCLTSLNTMLQIELPHINILSKVRNLAILTTLPTVSIWRSPVAVVLCISTSAHSAKPIHNFFVLWGVLDAKLQFFIPQFIRFLGISSGSGFVHFKYMAWNYLLGSYSFSSLHLLESFSN